MLATQEMSFAGILNKLLKSLTHSMLFGFSLGVLYRIGTPHLQRTLLNGIQELSSPVASNGFGLLGLITLGLGIAAKGRSNHRMSSLRRLICYQPLLFALTISTVFFGTCIGFCFANLPNNGVLEVIVLAVYALVFIVGGLLALLRASFSRTQLPLSERQVRLLALMVGIVSVNVLYLSYFR